MARRPTASPSTKPFLSVEETALLVGESRATLYRAIQRGDFPLPVVRLGARLRVPRRAVERLLDGSWPPPPVATTEPTISAVEAEGRAAEAIRGATT